MTYPKAWITAIEEASLISRGPNVRTVANADEVLCNLAKVGALKEPKKPREWWICPKCMGARPKPEYHEAHHMECSSFREWVHVREVIE